MPKLHIDEVYPKDSVYIVNFQNGYTTDNFSSRKCSLKKDKNTGEKTVTTELDGLVYSGKEMQEELGKTVIVARNKITGKVRLIEVGNVELKPVIGSKTQNKSLLDTSRLELSRKFGSKKQKKYMEQKEKLKLNVDTVAQQMHNVTINVTDDQLDISSYVKTDSDDFYIPPINRLATKPEDVYDLCKILSKEQYEAIHTEIQLCKDKDLQLKPWMKQMFAKKTLSAEHEVLLFYASVLLKLYGLVMRDIQKRTFIACPISNTLNNIVLENFTTIVKGKRTRPLQYKDKTLCHALVFLLLINNLKCDLEELTKHTNYNAKTLATKFRLIGATLVVSGDKKYVQLKLPLASVASARRKSAKF